MMTKAPFESANSLRESVLTLMGGVIFKPCAAPIKKAAGLMWGESKNKKAQRDTPL
jgi:hypothetical protein